MSGTLTNAVLFLIKTLFDLYLLILMVRLILAFAHANYFNPLIRLIVIATRPLVDPLRRVIPNYKRIELSTALIIFVIEVIKITLVCLITIGIPNIFTLFEISFIEMLKLLLQTFFYAILLQAIMSWFQTGDSPAKQVLQHMSSLILRPLQRIVPSIGGVDITPIPALLLLQLLIILLPG